MTPQEVIEKFMAELNANSYSSSTSSVGTKMLDDAVKASSDFTNTQAVINQMLTDQAAAEREAIKYVLGDKYSSSYDGKQLSQISLPSMTWDEVKDKTAFNLGDTYGSYFYSRGNITLANIIKENAARIFLEKYCGIQLNENYVVDPSSGYGIDGLKVNGTFLSNKSLETPNSDTGAITGSDANLTLKVGEVIDGTTLTAAHLNALAKKYGSAAKLSGDTLVIGTGVEKTEYSVVPEAGNMYLFTAAGTAKNINTGSNGWVVNATSGNDTITSGGRDSVNAGAGNDKIIANADEATITTGNGNDTVEISASVKSVTIIDLNSYDTLKISGTFEIGSAKLENSMLVVTDKTGTRKIKFSDLTNVGNAKIGAQTISTWLSNSGYNLNNLASGDVAEFDTTSGDVSDAGRAAIDPNYKPAQIDDVANQDVAQTQTISSATNINLDNVSISSGTVTSGGTTVGTVSSVTPAVMNFTTKGLTIHVGNGTATSYNQLTSAQKMMVAALFKWWAKESLELNEESYGISFESDTAKVTDITLSFENIGGNTLAQVGSYYRGDNISKLVLQINNNYYNSFTPSDKDGISTVNGAGFLDRTLAHEFTHAVMATNINNFHNLPQFIREGMAELTHGIDDERGYEIFKLAYDSSSLSNALNLSNTSTGNTIAYSGGYMFLRYFAKQSALQSLDLTNLDISDTTPADTTPADTTPADTTPAATTPAGIFTEGNDTYNNTVDNVQLSALGGDDFILNSGDSVMIDGGKGNDEISNYKGSSVTIVTGDGDDEISNYKGSNVTINAGDGNDEISNYKGSNVMIDAGAGDDTFDSSGGSNLTIIGGKGDDSIKLSNSKNNLIEYTSGDGKDTVYGFDTSSTLKIGGGTGTYSTTKSGNDIIVSVGSGYILLKDAASLSAVNISGKGTTPADTTPADTTPADTTPADTTPADTTPADTTPADTTPADTTPADTTPADTTPADTTPADTTPADTTPADTTPADTTPADTTPADTTPADTTPADTTPADTTPAATIVSGIFTEGNDTYNNTVDNVQLLALNGDDRITNSGANVYIDGMGGNDNIQNIKYLYGDTSANMTVAGVDNVTVSGGDGADYVHSTGAKGSINGGADNDRIYVLSKGKYVNGKYVLIETSDNTVDGGAGDDKIYTNDVYKSLLKGGAGNDYFHNGGFQSTIYADEGNDTIANLGHHATIFGGEGDDSIFNSGSSVMYTGHDEYVPHYGNDSFIDGGEGNDTIENYVDSHNTTIYGGAGDDFIKNNTSQDSLNGGAGNDRISLGSNSKKTVIEYTTGDGLDTVWGFKSDDTLQIGGGTGTYSSTKSGNDILVTVGDGSVLLKNVVSLSKVNIVGKTGDDTTPADTTPAGTIISGIFTEGNDTYTNTVDNVQLLALGGDDKITNSGANVYIDGMGGNDSIYNTGASVSIDLGGGNDFIITGDGTSSKTTVFGGEGNDSINNNFYGSNSVLDGGKGDDYLHNNASNVLVKGGEGNDFIDITYYGVNTTINGGEGNDQISITSQSHRDLIEYTDGDGFDTVYGFNATDTLQIGGGTGTYSTTKSGNDIVVSVGSGSVLLKNAAGLAPLNIAGTDKTPTTPAGVRINNYTKNTLIASGAGNDTIYNSAASVTVDSGAGDDSIYSHGYYVTINSGDGNDTIYNSPYSDRVTINAGAGDDYVQDGNFNTFTKVSLGAGDDTFVNHWSDTLTISGGTGNDSIKISAHSNENVFEYAAGDGDDTIYGFKPTDTLSLTGGAITGSLVSGDDLILNVGTGSIKFINTRSVNVNGTVFNPSPSNNGTSGHDFITNFDDGATINGYGDSDKIANAGDNVLINTGDGDNSIGNFGNNTTIVTGNGNNTILGGTYANASIVAGSGNDSIHNGWTSSTIDAGAGNDTIVNHYTSLIKGGAGDDVIRDGNDGTEEDGIGHPRSTLIGGTGNDTIYALAGWDSEELIEYTPGDGHDVVYGFSAKDTLVINDVGGKNTYSTQKSGNDILVTVGDGSILLKNVTSLSSANLVYETLSAQEKKTIRLTEGKDNYSNSLEGATILALGGDDSIYNSYSNVSIAGMGGNDSIYNRGSNVTIDGGAGNDSIRNNGSKVTIRVGEGDDSIYNYSDSVTIDSGAGNDTLRNNGSNVTIDSGADNDFILSSGVNVTISGGKGNDSVNLYNAKDNVIEYTSGDGNDTIWHFGDDDTLKISGGTYSTAKSGNDILVTVGDGSILLKNAATLSAVNISSTDTTPADTTPADTTPADTTPADTTPAGIFTEGNDTYNNTVDNVQLSALGGDDSISNTGNNVTISGGKDNDQISLGSGAKNNVIEYTSGDGSDTVYGFNSDDTLQIGGGDYSTAKSGDDVIVSIGGGTILLKDAATLSAVNISGTEETSARDEFYWTFSNGTAAYVKKNGTATETLFTLSELNSSLTANTLDSVVKIDGTQITLMSGALGQKDVTLTTSGDYTLALDADCPTVTAVGKSWKLNGTTATYHDAGKSEGYALTNSKTVTYTAPVVGKTTLKVSGLVNGLEVVDGAIDGVELNGKVLTVKPEVVGENLSVTKGYKVIFDEGDYGGSTFTGTSAKDTIEVKGSSLEIDGGEGNDTITSKGDGGNIYLFAADNGKDVVVGYGDKDIIKIMDDSDVSVSVKGKDIIVTAAGKGSMTLKDAAKNGTRINIVDSNDKTLVDETYYTDRIVDGNSVTLISAFKDKIYTAEDPITAVDGSVVSRKFSLTGGDADNTLIGGGGANFIDGGKGENILTGGKGNDTFVTGLGNDTITDYGIGTDKISIGADITDFSVKNGDIILNFGDDKSLTIQNGDGKKINFLQNGKTSTEIFTTDGKTNTKGTSITLAPSTEDYTATAKMLTIDGGLTDSVWIVGNTKANKIFGGDGNDTLNGGSGKDTLTGGAGSDIFVYESGKDTITDYVSGEDKISLGAAATSESLDSKGNVVLKFAGTNSLTISKGDETSVRTITFTGEDGDTTKIYYSEQIVGADSTVTLQSTFKGNTFAATNDLPNVDASAITKKFTLTGGAEDNTLIGGTKADFIDGGDGSDLLIGGNGNDTFVYSSGDDTIGDYDVKESISLSSAVKNFDLSGDDVIIGFDEGSLTIKDAAGKSITLVETGGNTQVNVFAADGIFNSATNKATAVTLAADTSIFNAASYSKLVTIDGGIVSDAAEIVGNAKNNLIFAGNAGATINGGKGNDTLWGGSGSDTFIYDNKGGQDIVYGFGDEDALQINGNFTATVNNNSIAFKVGSQTDALTLQNYTATDFNINGDTYQVSGNTLAKK